MLSVHHEYPRSRDRSPVVDGCAGASAPFLETSPRFSGQRRSRAMMLLLTAIVVGCESPPGPFAGAAPSLEALAGEVLGALSQGDLGALERLRLTEREHNEIVWPELPVSAPEVNFPVEFAWANMEARNASALARIDDFYEGLQATLVSGECAGETQTFDTFQVLTDCWVTFSQAASPEFYRAQLFKDVIVRGGGYKIFRYYDGEARSHPSGAAD